jgi:DNA-directed RNA polymerase subunit M/transcription elongation factor TFIIS
MEPDGADTGLRTSARRLLERACAAGGAEPAAELAAALEAACFARCADGAGGGAPGRLQDDAYLALARALALALPRPYGAFLEASLAAFVARGAVAPADAVDAKVFDAHAEPDPRQVSRARLYAILAADARFDAPLRRELATKIESGCYNAAIAHCSQSAESYRRHWSSEMFVSIYSAAVGRVAANLDPAGGVARALPPGAPRLIDRLAAADVSPSALGAMTEIELCPEASQAVRAAVELRVNQKIEEKTSALFMCPRPSCRARSHTYRIVQIGAADEPSTFMCTCKVCGLEFEGRG